MEHDGLMANISTLSTGVWEALIYTAAGLQWQFPRTRRNYR
jgi:hypothetical protein